MKKYFLLSLLLGMGCAKQSFVLEENYQSFPKVEQPSHFFIYGVAQEDLNDLTNTCPNGVGKIEAYLSPKDIAIQIGIGVLSVGTLGWIYTPRTWKVYCK